MVFSSGDCGIARGSGKVVGIAGELFLGVSMTGCGACLVLSWCGRNFRSSRIDLRSAGCFTGMNFLRNFLFLRVLRPDPSVFTTYWSNCFTSVMRPVLSHFVGNWPVWFCIRTWSPTTRGGSRRVCSVHCSADFICLFRRASSLLMRVSLHVGCGA